MKRRAAPFVLAVLVGVVLVQTGCSLGPQDLVQIAGTVQGDSLSAAQSAQNVLTGIAATVTCNGVSAQASGDGKYSLSVPKASTYRCTATKPPAYAPESVTISGRSGASIALSFGATHLPACHLDLVSFDVQCTELHFQPGTLRGTVSYNPGGAPAADVTVECPDLASIAGGFAGVPQWFRSLPTDQTGAFSLPGLSVGSYNCIAVTNKGDVASQHVSIQPGSVINTAFQLCNAGCPPVRYHLGRVMHTYTAYLVFWQPQGRTFEPGGSDATYKSLLERYFQDIGGTSFYNLLTQYWDYQGAIQNDASYGGAFVDTTPYEHCDINLISCRPAAATKSDPLYDSDIRAEVTRALKKNPSWHAGDTSEFIVFTGYGAEECFTSASTSQCTWKQDNGFCGYHDSFFGNVSSASGPPSIYAYIPDHANDGGGCAFTTGFATPNHDSLADATINTVSHEQFESITDPMPEDAPGWYDDSPQARRDFATEIGDKCVRALGNVDNDGGNITLKNGDRYLLQEEWSNRAGRCAQS